MEDFFGFVIGIFFGLLLGIGLMGLFQKDTTQTLQREAIQLNFANYNPTNGNWQWRTNR